MKLILICSILSLGAASPTSYMVGGVLENPRNVQWLVEVEVAKEFRAAATYLNQKHVVTVASKFPEFPTGEISRGTVILKEAYFEFQSGYTAVNIYKHELYKAGSSEFDVAILALSSVTSEYLLGKVFSFR